MITPGDPAHSWRRGRAVLLALLAWAITATAHVAAGGQAPEPAVSVALILLTAWPLAFLPPIGRGCRSACVALLLVAQAVMHVLLVFLSGAAPTLQGDPHAGHGADGLLAHGPADASGHAMGLVPDAPMIAAHALGALVLGLVLAHGERLLLRLVDVLAHQVAPRLGPSWQTLRLLAACLTGLPAVHCRAATAPAAYQPPRLAAVHVHCRAVLWRGPPRPA